MARIHEQGVASTLQPTSILKDASSLIFSFFLCSAITLLFVLTSERQFLHWFVLPVTLCGVIIGVDAIDWFRHRLDTFDPIGIVGIFGFHFFFLAPLLHILWDHQLLYIQSVEDWRPWLGYMGILNFVGLLFYRASRTVFKPQSRSPVKIWQFDLRLLPIVLLFAVLITAGLQFLVYQQFGGISGYLNTFEETILGSTGFTGFGTLFAISESFPLLLLISYAIIARNRPHWRSWLVILCVLAIFFFIRILFGGLRGSRSNTLFVMVWALGVVHLYIRPVPRKIVYLGVVFSLGFMYLFGFFKNVGSDAFTLLQDPGRFVQLEQTTKRTLQVTLLSDLGRADIQAYVLYRLTDSSVNYRYGYGISYVSGLLTPIPDVLWSQQLTTKVDLGSNVLYGDSPYLSSFRRSSRIYGLAGEAMLNLGPFAVPFSFILLGLLVSRVHHWLHMWSANDTRRVLLPFLILLCLLVLTNDTDNNAVFLVKQSLVPFLVIWISSKTIRGTS